MNILEIRKKHVSCYENKHYEGQHEPMLRFWRSSPNAATIQVVAHCGIAEYGRGVKRNMLSHLDLGVADLIQLRDQISKTIDEIKAHDQADR